MLWIKSYLIKQGDDSNIGGVINNETRCDGDGIAKLSLAKECAFCSSKYKVINRTRNKGMGAGQRLLLGKLLPWKVWPRWVKVTHCRLLVWGPHQWSGGVSYIVNIQSLLWGWNILNSAGCCRLFLFYHTSIHSLNLTGYPGPLLPLSICLNSLLSWGPSPQDTLPLLFHSLGFINSFGCSGFLWFNLLSLCYYCLQTVYIYKRN